MVYLFALLFLVSLIAALIGLVKPSVFQFGEAQHSESLESFGICLLLSFISLAMVGVFAPDVEDKDEYVQNVKAEPLKEVNKAVDEKDLGLTAEQFRKELNTQLQKVNVSYLNQVQQFKNETGEVNNTINYMFTEAVGLVGTVSKQNDNIKEITINLWWGFRERCCRLFNSCWFCCQCYFA